MEGSIMADLRASGFGGVPKGNTANRSVQFPSPNIGDVYYNGQLEILEIYNGTSWVAVSAPPATPSIVSVTDASTGDAYTSTAGKLAVVFTPGDGGSTPSQYNAYTTSGGHSAFSSSATVTLTGLTPGTAYTVYGNARNNFGTTVNTPNFAPITPTTFPEAPTIGTATASNSVSEVTVTWTLGSNGGKNLTSITITPFLNGVTAETPRTAETTTSTSYTFTAGQLTSGGAYTFKVKATNANGTSADSTASNSATMPITVAVDYLVLAGGGGGGRQDVGGGGGAGGYRTSYGTTGGGGSAESQIFLIEGIAYNITVGPGGTGGTGSTGATAGGNSSIIGGSITITSTGGGGGGAGNGGSTAGGPGGSGGGGGWGGNVGGTRTESPVQGYGGGTANGTQSGSSAAGGGGGAGAVGATSTGSGGNATRGTGGVGISSSITGTAVVRGGGGGGGGDYTAVYGYGGDGGGGNGGPPGAAGSPGSQNYGGGGGGGGGFGGGQPGGNGGSGVVILRWLTSAASITVGSGLIADATGTDGSYSYKRFTSGSGNVSFT